MIAELRDWWNRRNDPAPLVKDTVTKTVHTYASNTEREEIIHAHQRFGWIHESTLVEHHGFTTLTFRRYDGAPCSTADYGNGTP